MEVKAVSTAVMLKLTDTINEESVADNKKLKHQLEKLQESIQQQERFLEEEDVSQKTRDHLRDIYEVEDAIDIFSFQVARQTKTLFFNNFSSFRRLRQKTKKIQIRISSSEDVAATARSLRHSDSDQWSENSSSSLTTISDTQTTGEEDNKDDGDDDDDFYYETQALTQKSVSDVWPISEIPTTPSPERKKLTFSYSYNEKAMNIRGSKEEYLPYPKQISTFCYQEEEVGIFGLKDDVKILVKRLTQQQEEYVSRFTNDVTGVVKQELRQNEIFVQVVGEVGSGKTTLARAVYKNRKIKDHFESHDWISVKQEDTADHILLSLLKTVPTVKDNGRATSSKDQPLKTRVFNHLKGKRYLIVLDGVRSHAVLEDLVETLPDEDNGSKILFTSCEVGKSPKTNINPHKMSPLNEKESWNMFLKKAGKEKEAGLIEPRLKGRILNICRGLPLNIVLIARLLSTKRIQRWSSVIVRDQCSKDVLNLCYNDLSIQSKLCLLYLSAFPKDYDIPVRRLLRLWLAEGYETRRSEETSPEDLVQTYFDELVDRSMIEITKLRSDNSPRHCRLVSVLHDYLLPKAREIHLFRIHPNFENFGDDACPFGVRRMVQHMSTTGVLAANKEVGNSRSILSNVQLSQTPSSTFDPSRLRSYLSFNFHGRDMPEKEVGRVLGRIIYSNFRLLRVLDLEGVYKPILPNKLGNLCQLRYLGLRWTYLENLPESVGDLSNLETLDVKHTHVVSLPDSISKLKKLRHLNLNNIRLAMPPSSSCLVTLWGLLLDEKIPVEESLGKLRDLRELGIQFNLSKSQGVLVDWIAKLKNLQSLRLRSVGPSKLVLKSLVKLAKLSHLDLYGSLERLPAPNEFPPTVKVLTLSTSLLNKDPMETLEQLPALIVLRLLKDSYEGKRLVCHRGGFKKLEVLKLWRLEELEEWILEEGAMESLKELNVRGCEKLRNIPCRLLQKQRCLEELVLTNMPDDFVARIKKRKFKDTSLTINYLE